MNYQFIDNSSGIIIQSDFGSMLLLKHGIKDINVFDNNKIKITTGCCFCSLYINHGSVSIPYTTDPAALVAILNSWLNNIPPSPISE